MGMNNAEITRDALNQLNNLIAILNGEMESREAAGQDGTDSYDDLSALEASLCKARATAERIMKRS